LLIWVAKTTAAGLTSDAVTAALGQ
jgi:hypothetical protein